MNNRFVQPAGGIRCANPRCRRDGDPEPVYGRQAICEFCARRLEEQLHELARKHGELQTVLAAGGATTARFDKVGGSRTPPVPVRLEVSDHRDHIRHLLVSWTGLVIEERRMSRWPDDRPSAMAGYLASHLDWLAEHPAAGDLCGEVSIALGRAWRLLEPPEKVVWVPCPDFFQVGCAGKIPVSVDATLVWCSVCGFETDNLGWLGRLLRSRDAPLVTAVEGCHRLRVEGIEVKPATIRSWVRRKKLVARDRDPAGRALYDIDELTAIAARPKRQGMTSANRA